MHQPELLVPASYYGSAVVRKLSSAPHLCAEAVRTGFSARLLSTTAALPHVVFIACHQHTPTANCPHWATQRLEHPVNTLHRHLSSVTKELPQYHLFPCLVLSLGSNERKSQGCSLCRCQSQLSLQRQARNTALLLGKENISSSQQSSCSQLTPSQPSHAAPVYRDCKTRSVVILRLLLPCMDTPGRSHDLNEVSLVTALCRD